MVCSMAAIMILPVEMPTGMIVFAPVDMTADTILHFIQTPAFVPAEMTVG